VTATDLGSGCFPPAILVVKTSDTRQSNHRGAIGRAGFDGPTDRRIADRGMNSLIVVVVDIFPEQPSQMVFVQDDDVIEKLSAHASNEPFSGSVLPWASERRALGVAISKLLIAPVTTGEKIASLS
jgi:hypothetical protein